MQTTTKSYENLKEMNWRRNDEPSRTSQDSRSSAIRVDESGGIIQTVEKININYKIWIILKKVVLRWTHSEPI